jgi:UDP-glucuronate decarboxylase
LKALVTGGAGFIGFHLSKYLLERDYEVTICDNLSRGRMDKDLEDLVVKKHLSFVKADLTDQSHLPRLENDYDLVYHLAAINGTSNFYKIPYEVLRVNVLSLLNVLEWIKDADCNRLVWLSSSETYGGLAGVLDFPVPTAENVAVGISDVFNARFSYAASKIAGELLCINYARAHELKVSIVRPHNIYGPRMGYDHVVPQFIMRIMEKENPFKIRGSENTRSFCYVDDCVEAIRLIAESAVTDVQIFNVGNDKQEITMANLASKMFDLFGFHPKVEVYPAPDGSVARRCPDIGKIRHLLSYEPRVDLEDGLQKTYLWYSANPS